MIKWRAKSSYAIGESVAGVRFCPEQFRSPNESKGNRYIRDSVKEIRAEIKKEAGNHSFLVDKLERRGLET